MECPICLDPIVLEDHFVTYCAKQCRKLFHRSCIEESKLISCPMCRVDWRTPQPDVPELSRESDVPEFDFSVDSNPHMILVIGRACSGKSYGVLTKSWRRLPSSFCIDPFGLKPIPPKYLYDVSDSDGSRGFAEQ